MNKYTFLISTLSVFMCSQAFALKLYIPVSVPESGTEISCPATLADASVCSNGFQLPQPNPSVITNICKDGKPHAGYSVFGYSRSEWVQSDVWNVGKMNCLYYGNNISVVIQQPSVWKPAHTANNGWPDSPSTQSVVICNAGNPDMCQFSVRK